MSDHILPWHIMSFQALTSGRDDTFMLVDCYVGETPSAAIAMVRETRNGVEVMPLFVAMTRDMDVTFPDRDEEEGSGSGGGPSRADIQRQFAMNMSLTDPH